MNNYKEEIIHKIRYTDLVYGRINKKLKTNFSITEIKEIIDTIVFETCETEFQKKGKNIYIRSLKKSIKLTINSYTNTIITVDKLDLKIDYFNNIYKIKI